MWRWSKAQQPKPWKGQLGAWRKEVALALGLALVNVEKPFGPTSDSFDYIYLSEGRKTSPWPVKGIFLCYGKIVRKANLIKSYCFFFFISFGLHNNRHLSFPRHGFPVLGYGCWAAHGSCPCICLSMRRLDHPSGWVFIKAEAPPHPHEIDFSYYLSGVTIFLSASWVISAVSQPGISNFCRLLPVVHSYRHVWLLRPSELTKRNGENWWMRRKKKLSLSFCEERPTAHQPAGPAPKERDRVVFIPRRWQLIIEIRRHQGRPTGSHLGVPPPGRALDRCTETFPSELNGPSGYECWWSLSNWLPLPSCIKLYFNSRTHLAPTNHSFIHSRRCGVRLGQSITQWYCFFPSMLQFLQYLKFFYYYIYITEFLIVLSLGHFSIFWNHPSSLYPRIEHFYWRNSSASWIPSNFFFSWRAVPSTDYYFFRIINDLQIM